METEQESSSFSRKVVNLFAAMAAGHPELPRVLADHGYRCIGIERPFYATGNRQVHPELSLASESLTHCLLLEAKSGANLNEDQLQRYALVSSQALLDAQFPPKSTAEHNIVLVGKQELGDRLAKGSAKAPDPRRVMLLISAEGLVHAENSFSNDELNSAFIPAMKINWGLFPNSYLPVDVESPLWEFAAALFPELIAGILRGESSLNLDAVAKSFIRHWALFHRRIRSGYETN